MSFLTSTLGRIDFTADFEIAKIFEEYLDEMGILDKDTGYQNLVPEPSRKYFLELFEDEIEADYENASHDFPGGVTEYSGVDENTFLKIISDFVVRVDPKSFSVDKIEFRDTHDLFNYRYDANSSFGSWELEDAFKKAAACAASGKTTYLCYSVGNRQTIGEKFFEEHAIPASETKNTLESDEDYDM